MKLSIKKYFLLLIKHMAMLGLFIILPLFATLLIGQGIISIEQNKHISELSSRVNNTLKDIESEVSQESFLLKVSRGAWYCYINNKENYWNYYEQLCRFLKSEPDLYLFDEKGKIVTPNKYNLKSKFLASKLWDTIETSYEEKEKIALRFKKQFTSFLGNEFKVGYFLDSRNSLMPIIVNAKKGYLYWMNSHNNSKEGIILVFWDIPPFEFRVQQIIKRYSSQLENIFIRNPDDSIQAFFNNNNDNTSEYKEIYQKTVLLNSKDYFIDQNERLWRYSEFEKICILACSKSKNNFYTNLGLFYTRFIILLSILLVMAYFWLSTQQKQAISIRVKLIVIFLIAVLTPVLGFSYLGYQYISDIGDNLKNQVRSESRNILLNIDRELGNSGNVFRGDFKKMVTDFQHYDEDEQIRKFFAESISKNDLIEIEKRSVNDGSLKKQIINNVISQSINAFTDPFSKCCIEQIYNNNVTKGVDPIVKKVILSPEGAMASFYDRPDNVQNFLFGTNEFYLYWCISSSEKYGDEFYFILRDYNKLIREHLINRLKKCKTKAIEEDYLIFAFNNRKEEWLPNNSLQSILKTYARRLKHMGKPIEAEINIGSKTYLLLGIIGGKLRGYSFYALYPYERIQSELTEKTVYIVIFIIIFIAMAMAIGFILSSIFLNPVQQLERGVKAIKLRDTKYRIEIVQNDEFGSLAESFNKVIGNLKEMELASYIQESLLPKSLPKIDEYEISFSNKMASGVGGDYFDTILLDKDNLCIIIGDVSGHGVASALVMAIAKAVLYHGFNKTRDLLELFSKLNSVINTYFGKPPVKKMITLFATIVNLPTGRGIFVDAGHNYPMKISEDGQITELKMVGLPVGVLKKIKKQKIDEYTINKGETIVFYTDGIVEATGKTPEQYGYERFKKHLSEMARENPDTIKKNLLENYTKWEDGTEPDDDVTLVVFKRLSPENNESNIIC